MPLQQFAELGQGSGVHHILGAEPSFAGKGDAKVEEVQVGCLVGIGVDAAEDPEVSGLVPPTPVEVESPGVGVQFDPSPSGGRSVENLWNVQGVGFPVEEEAPRRMAQAGDIFILHGVDDAISHLFFVRAESGMNGGDDIIEFRKERIGKIEFSAFQDVTFGPGEEGALGLFRIQGVNLFDLGMKAFFIQTMSLEGGFGVVGDTEPFESKVGGGLGHGGEGVLPIAGESVVVEAAADLVAGKEVGQIVFFGSGDFPAVLAEFGRDEG